MREGNEGEADPHASTRRAARRAHDGETLPCILDQGCLHIATVTVF
jgi:hypothetical protein